MSVIFISASNSGGGSGTIGGTIASGQIAYGSALDTIAGDANLTWDSAAKMFALTGDWLQSGSMTAVGDSFVFNQIPVPSSINAAIASPAAPGNVDNGTHNYVMTYVTSNGNETYQSTASSVVTIANKTINGQVSLTALAVSANPNVVSKNIYRDFNHDGVYKLLVNLPNATTTYIDNTANASLGALAPTINNTGYFEIDGNIGFGGAPDSSYQLRNYGETYLDGDLFLASSNVKTPTDNPGVFFTIPISNSDSSTHTWGFAIGGQTLFEVQADGDGVGGVRAFQIFSQGAYAHTGTISASGGFINKMGDDDVSNPPTAAELTTMFGDPSALGVGYTALVNDNQAGLLEYIVWTDGNQWFYILGTKAL